MKWYPDKRVYLYLVLIAFLGGCILMKNEMNEPSSSEMYFSSPQEAVSRLAELVRNKEFKTLAKYYDLSGSDIPLADLESGDFFIRTERPEMAHPAGFWRYKHPFPPGFRYSSTRPSTREGVYIISVSVLIDEGSDIPNQEGLSLFYMVKSTKGWQVLPDQVAEDERPEILGS